MLFRRNEKRVLVLSPAEVRILRTALLELRSSVLAHGDPAEDIDRVLRKII